MASQTTRKSSPESEDGFQPLSFERVNSEPSVKPAVPARPGLSTFEVSPAFWNALLSDPGLRAEWDRALEEKVNERLGESNASYRAALTEEAREQGRRLGLADARAEIQAVADNLNQICREVLEAKEAILRAHEKEWAEALSHLLRRFLAPQPEALAARLETWLSESLAGFAGKQLVRVRLSSSDYEQLKKALGEDEHRKFALVRDVSLAPGDVHAECEGGGFFFSPAREAEKLEGIMEEFFATGSRAGGPA